MEARTPEEAPETNGTIPRRGGASSLAPRRSAGHELAAPSSRWYTFLVENKNLADPNFEPSDEQLSLIHISEPTRPY